MKRGRGGVKYEDLRIGDGPCAERGVSVEIRCDLTLNRGDCVQTDQRCRFRIGARQVVAGLEYGVEGMRVGGERRIRVGPHLGYRSAGVVGEVPADAVLEFRVTLLYAESAGNQ